MKRVISLRGGISLGLLSVLSMTGCAALSQTQEGAILGFWACGRINGLARDFGAEVYTIDPDLAVQACPGRRP